MHDIRQCVSEEQEILAAGQTVSRFLLRIEGPEYTATGTVMLKLCRGEKKLTIFYRRT